MLHLPERKFYHAFFSILYVPFRRTKLQNDQKLPLASNKRSMEYWIYIHTDVLFLLIHSIG